MEHPSLGIVPTLTAAPVDARDGHHQNSQLSAHNHGAEYVCYEYLGLIPYRTFKTYDSILW
ncbi:hypothetical protein VRK_06000 [Vibrio sp. MEBiC08052]|nr:hypothetical protein VRK_06000 [Vibrio sp. MEBiC08052]